MWGPTADDQSTAPFRPPAAGGYVRWLAVPTALVGFVVAAGAMAFAFGVLLVLLLSVVVMALGIGVWLRLRGRPLSPDDLAAVLHRTLGSATQRSGAERDVVVDIEAREVSVRRPDAGPHTDVSGRDVPPT